MTVQLDKDKLDSLVYAWVHDGVHRLERLMSLSQIEDSYTPRQVRASLQRLKKANKLRFVGRQWRTEDR